MEIIQRCHLCWLVLMFCVNWPQMTHIISNPVFQRTQVTITAFPIEYQQK